MTPHYVEWDKLPYWMQWVAVDENGDVFGYELKPRIRDEGDVWILGRKNVYRLQYIWSKFIIKDNLEGVEWRQSLIERPAQE